jgi:hypothetical protein
VENTRSLRTWSRREKLDICVIGVAPTGAKRDLIFIIYLLRSQTVPLDSHSGISGFAGF